MNQSVSYRSTIYASYLGFVILATVVNLTPILFIPLREQFGLTFEQMGRLVFINFITQVATDLYFSRLVDKHGFRPFIVLAQVMAFLGFGVFAIAPRIFAQPYVGFMVATVIFSCGGGLLELLVSPIVNAIPTDEKASAMNLLHSFYAWGQVAVVLITTLLLLVLGSQSWPWIIMGWMVLPVINFFLFLRVPLAPMVPEEHRMPMIALLRSRFFAMILIAIATAGASELVMAQWTSTFMEKALNLPKIVGDVAGVTMFAFMLGVGRALYGKYGAKLNLQSVMIAGTALAFFCYLVVAFSPWPLLSLVACALTGLAVSSLWPGSLVIASERFPLAGASMFALLAAGGDTGASVGPWMSGVVADLLPGLVNNLPAGIAPEEIGLRAGMLLGAIFPLAMFACMRWIMAQQQPKAAPMPEAKPA